MNESSSSTNDEDKSEPRAGERLAAARQSLNISITDVAKELHLDEPKVQALEENRFDDLGAPVFAKGHMRKYAELVGVPFDDLLVDYYQLNRSAGAPPVVGIKKALPRDISVGPWIGGALAVVILGVGGWWWFTREPAPEQPDMEPAVLAPFTDNAVVNETDSAEQQQETVTVQPEPAVPDDSVDSEPATASPEESLGEPVRIDLADIPAADLMRLELAYSGDCWTEVTDANGQRLYFELGTAGGTASVSGAAPFRVLLGNGDNVSLTVDGVAYTIPASQRRGNTARFTLNKQ